MMKRLIILLACAIMLIGCAPSEVDLEKEMEREEELETIKAEIYREAYEEGYRDAVDATIEEMPWQMIEMEELEDSLYIIFDDGEYAEEIRDQILSYCEIYESGDFRIGYSDSAMDYDY